MQSKKLKQPIAFHVEGKPELAKSIIQYFVSHGHEDTFYLLNKMGDRSITHLTINTSKKIGYTDRLEMLSKYKIVTQYLDNPDIWEEEKENILIKIGCRDIEIAKADNNNLGVNYGGENDIEEVPNEKFKQLAELAGYRVYELHEKIDDLLDGLEVPRVLELEWVEKFAKAYPKNEQVFTRKEFEEAFEKPNIKSIPACRSRSS